MPEPVLAEIEPQAIIILVVMIIGAIRWFLENFRKKNEIEGDEDSPFEDLYEEARREIQERQAREYPTEEELGRQLQDYRQPEPQVVMAPAIPPPLPPKKRPTPSSSTPSFDYNTALKRSQPKPQLSDAERAALERWNQATPGRSQPRRRSGHGTVRDLLANPTAARDAIVLREILGPPKGMESPGGQAQ